MTSIELLLNYCTLFKKKQFFDHLNAEQYLKCNSKTFGAYLNTGQFIALSLDSKNEFLIKRKTSGLITLFLRLIK
jgi:hypothetical protein